jgi:hypothetical protein
MGLIDAPPRRINGPAWAAALPEMSSPSHRPERCANSLRVRVPDTQMHELRPRVVLAWRSRRERWQMPHAVSVNEP